MKCQFQEKHLRDSEQFIQILNRFSRMKLMEISSESSSSMGDSFSPFQIYPAQNQSPIGCLNEQQNQPSEDRVWNNTRKHKRICKRLRKIANRLANTRQDYEWYSIYSQRLKDLKYRVISEVKACPIIDGLSRKRLQNLGSNIGILISRFFMVTGQLSCKIERLRDRQKALKKEWKRMYRTRCLRG